MANPIPTQLSPGVNVSEIDLSTFVAEESPNVGGMAGVFNWGPCLVGTRVTTESDLASVFGKPTLDQFDVSTNMDFNAASNFLRYSNNLRVVRVLQDGDYNAVSTDPGITWINSVTYTTIKNEDEFRDLGGFSGNAGIEPTSHFKARYPGNFGNALGVVVFDGTTAETITVGAGAGYRDYTLSGGYSNVATLSGISYGVSGVTLQGTYIKEIQAQDPDTGEPLFDGKGNPIMELIRVEPTQPLGKKYVTFPWYTVTFDIPDQFNSANDFINYFIDQGKFLYATGTTSNNRNLMENGNNPNGNNANVIPLRAFAVDYNGRESNPYLEFAIRDYAPGTLRDFIAPNSTNSRKVDFLFLAFDNTNFATNFRPGVTHDFGTTGSHGVQTIWTAAPLNSPAEALPNFPTNFGTLDSVGKSIFSTQSNNVDSTIYGKPFALAPEYDAGRRLWQYTNVWSGVGNLIDAVAAGNGLGWSNLIGITGTRIVRTKDDSGMLGTAAINFDSEGGLTGIRRNFGNGIVQLGDFQGTSTTTFEESYESTRIFDKMPGTSRYAEAVGGSNDEISIAVVDFGGKFGPRGGILEKFELLSKAVDAKNLDGQPIYYKDYINQNSRYVYMTKPFGFTGGGNYDSPATTAFGDIYTRYSFEGVTYNRTGFYDTSFDYGESSVNAVSAEELADGYSIFLNDDDAADVLFLPESSVTDDQSGDLTTVEQLIYDTVIQPRKDTILVIPTPPLASSSKQSSYIANNAINYRKSGLQLPSNSYTVLVAGRKLYFDAFNAQIRRMSLASDVAGIMCGQEQYWESPAGFARGNLKNALRLETNFTKADRDELYKNQINFFVNFNDGGGNVLLGDKTLLSKPSAFDRINVRRVFIAIEKAIARSAKYSLFEFNDEFTRSQFRNLVGPFLASLAGRRAIADFKVVCDETNNTAAVRDANQFVADIYIKPLKSINFIQLNFIATRSDQNLTTIE